MVQLVVEEQSSGNLHYLDISDVSIKGNYSAREIQEITEQKSDFTQSFTLPLSETNNNFFNHFYNVNVSEGTFDSSLKARASIYVDSNLVFEGYLQLLKVNNKTEFYEAVVFGEISNIASSLKESKLNELDLTEFNHILTRTNIKASWAGAITYASGSTGDEILYPIIDYGYNYTDFSLNNSSVGGGLLPTRLKPTIKVKTLFEKIRTNIGYTVSSTFFSTDFFKKQYMTLSQEFQTVQATFQDNFKVGMTTNQVLSSTGVIAFNDKTTSPFFDLAGNFNTATNAYAVTLSGYHRFRLKLKCALSGTGGVTEVNIAIKNLTTGAVHNLFPGSWNGTNNSPIVVGAGTQEIDVISENHIFGGGDSIAVQLTLLSSGANTMTIQSVGTEFSIFTSPVSEETSTIQFSAGVSPLPTETQIDFLSSIISRYNLIIALDKDVPFQLNIEPAQDYYDQGSTKDWSDKLDLNKDHILKPTNEFRKQAIKFQDLEGEGVLNTYWQNEFKHPYNNYEAELEGDFGEGLLEIKTIFESFNCKRIPEHDMMIQKNYKDENGQITFVSTKPQLFVYSGLKDCQDYRFWSQASNNFTTETQYPFCHHYLMAGDAVVDTDEDIRFKTAYSYDQPYFVNQWPLTDTYAKCWRRYLNNIYSKDARILEANFYLDPEDVASFQYNDKIFVLDNFYRINKISNYALGKNVSTKVELIKIIDSNLFDTNDILGCKLQWFQSNLDGSTVWINEVGATTTPTQQCCEDHNLTFVNNVCYWNYNPVTPPSPAPSPVLYNTYKSLTNSNVGGVVEIGPDAVEIKTNFTNNPSIYLGGQVRQLGKVASNGQYLRWNSATDQTDWGAAVEQIVAGSGISISPAIGQGIVTITATGGGGAVTQIIAGTNITVSPAGGTGAVTIASTASGMTSWTLQGDSGTDQTITNGDQVKLLGQGPITTTAQATDDVKIAHDFSGATPGSYTNANVTVDGYGHVTSVSSGSGGGGTPGGSNTQVQFNNSGAFAGNSQFTYNGPAGIVSASFFNGTHLGQNIGHRTKSVSPGLQFFFSAQDFDMTNDSACTMYTRNQGASVLGSAFNSRTREVFASIPLPINYAIKGFIIYSNVNVTCALFKNSVTTNTPSLLAVGTTNSIVGLSPTYTIVADEYYTLAVVRGAITDEINGAMIDLI